MTQKTITVNGHRYTAQQVSKLMRPEEMTVGGDYIINLGGEKFFANYRQHQDPPFAPTCHKSKADSIAIMPDDGSYKFSIWLEF